MSYRHGVYVSEKATGLVTPVNVESAMPVIIGTAPVHNLPEGSEIPVNEPRLLYSMSDFVSQFGSPGEGEKASGYTLYEAANIFFGRYAVSPMVAINVFDPEKHVKTVGEGDEADTLPDVSKVTADDIIGGIDSDTLKHTGLSLVDKVFPLFRIVPGQILAPRYSKDPSVAIAIGAKCREISGLFKCMGIIECADNLKNYTEAPAWLNDNNLTDDRLVCMFGDLLYNGEIESGSAHLASVIASRDAENEGVPYWSPSNKRIYAEGLVYGGEKIALAPTEGAYLNGNGIVTALNMVGGLVAWGDQTCAYPGVTDVKDSSIPIRRMFNWIGNTLILTAWQFVSIPATRRRIETIQDTFSVWLNGLCAREFILGGRVTFEEIDNPKLDMMDGKYRWHVYVTPPQAARELDFILEYDPKYLETLYGNNE